MYAAKDGGRDGYRLYQPPKRDSSVELAIASQLRLAERRDELELYYQPIVDLNQSCIVGAEALIRWNHPEAGLLLPGAFLPAAERTGLIRPITAWVLERALHRGAPLVRPRPRPVRLGQPAAGVLAGVRRSSA